MRCGVDEKLLDLRKNKTGSTGAVRAGGVDSGPIIICATEIAENTRISDNCLIV